MRFFFTLLLLANALFLGWQYFAEQEETGRSAFGGIVPVNEGLTLLSELPPASHPAHRELIPVNEAEAMESNEKLELIEPEIRAEVMHAVNTASGEASCYRSSPLQDVAAAMALQKKLTEQGITESKRESIQTQKINFWVMIKAYANRAEANKAAEALKKKRLKDFFIVRSGRYENAISLGVYSTKERAEQRYREIVALKTSLKKPHIEALELPAKRLVVTFSYEAPSLPEGVVLMLGTENEPYLEKISCK